MVKGQRHTVNVAWCYFDTSRGDVKFKYEVASSENLKWLRCSFQAQNENGGKKTLMKIVLVMLRITYQLHINQGAVVPLVVRFCASCNASFGQTFLCIFL